MIIYIYYIIFIIFLIISYCNALNLGVRPTIKPPPRYKDDYGVTHIKNLCTGDPNNERPLYNSTSA